MTNTPHGSSPYDSQVAAVEASKRRARKLVERCPASWQTTLGSEMIRRSNKGRAASSNESWAQAWWRAGLAIGDRPPASVTAEEWELVVNQWITEPQATNKGKPLSRAYAAGICVHLKNGLKRFVPGGKVPDEVKEALRVPVGPHKPKGRVLSRDDFMLLLDYVTTGWRSSHSARQTAEAVALLWMLWDSWMRVNELLGLNIGDVLDEGAMADLQMQPGRPLQKRGPRNVPILEGLPALRIWLQMHPAAGNPAAPLFCNFRSKTGLQRLASNNLDQTLKLWGERSGLHDQDKRAKKLSAHDLRHTGNTRAAKDRMDRSLRARKAGWNPKSRMPEHYDHQDEADLKAWMLRDAGIDAMGVRQTTGMDDATQLAIIERQRQAILDRLAKKAGNSPSSTPDWKEK